MSVPGCSFTRTSAVSVARLTVAADTSACCSSSCLTWPTQPPHFMPACICSQVIRTSRHGGVVRVTGWCSASWGVQLLEMVTTALLRRPKCINTAVRID